MDENINLQNRRAQRQSAPAFEASLRSTQQCIKIDMNNAMPQQSPVGGVSLVL